MSKVWQEFYCHRCEGGNYIMVKLNMALNYTAVVVCPMCGSKHERTIENGEIFDRGKSGSYREEICPPKSACSKEPRHSKIKRGARDGAVVRDENDIVRDHYMRQLWLDYYGGGQGDG
jgi:hypothetical protein